MHKVVLCSTVRSLISPEGKDCQSNQIYNYIYSKVCSIVNMCSLFWIPGTLSNLQYKGNAGTTIKDYTVSAMATTGRRLIGGQTTIFYAEHGKRTLCM